MSELQTLMTGLVMGESPRWHNDRLWLSDMGAREVIAVDLQGRLAFPNGIAVTPDNSTLIIAESYGARLTAFDISTDGSLSNRRVWADLPGAHPDGICVDAEGAVWYGDVPTKRCVRVREGGDVLQEIDLDRGCFACTLGGVNRTTLFFMAAEWSNVANMLGGGTRTGQVLTVGAPAPDVGWP